MSGSRRLAREYALRGLYGWLLSRQSRTDIGSTLQEDAQFKKADEAYFSQLLQGAIEDAPNLEAKLRPCLDREVGELSPVERGILLIGAYELTACPDVPYRVAINEAVELAKQYGGTDGHKYVNGVLDKLARMMRQDEMTISANQRNEPATKDSKVTKKDM
ncbi:MAG TPA: transcription antitermination factor NusB [Thiobacillaceae bacterium]|nr:transcription antitermination factor NusB [Thiobacillaceae bacterium]